MTAILLLILASTFSVAANAQPNPDTLWTRTYGRNGIDEAFSVQQTTDGGYVIAGYTESFGAEATDFYLIRTDSRGDTIWTRRFGGHFDDIARSCRQTSDGGFIMAGGTCSFGDLTGDFYLVKTNGDGDTLWTRTYDGSGAEYAVSIQQTADGGYLAEGISYLYSSGSSNLYSVRTDSIGDTLWTRIAGENQKEPDTHTLLIPDGDFIIVGSGASTGNGSIDINLVKTNGRGDTLWTRHYGGSGTDRANSVTRTTDGGYIIAGYSTSFGASEGDIYVLKTGPDTSNRESDPASSPK